MCFWLDRKTNRITVNRTPLGTSISQNECSHPGRFDLLANGGASLTLSFERAPFLPQRRTVWIPWGVFHVMDTLVMKREENDIPSCDLSGFVTPSPLVVASPLSTFHRSSPKDNPFLPETQVRMA